MKNVEIKVNGSKVTIEFDATKTFGPSSSGKTTIVASTEGPVKVDVPGGYVSVNLNVFKK